MINFAGSKILKHYNIRYTSFFVQSLKAHPKYPSLLSLSDILNEYQIENVCLKVDKNKISSIPVPFIAHVSNAVNNFIYIKDVSESHVLYESSDKGERWISLEEFNNKWEGIALITARSDGAGEPNYQVNFLKDIFRKVTKYLSVVGFLFIALISIISNQFFFRKQWVPLLGLGIVISSGFAVSLLLVQQAFNISSRITKKICGISSNTSCSDVLDSPAARIFGIVSLSEIGLLYYGGSLSALIFAPSFSTLLFLFCLSIASLPFTFFSIYYQAKILRKWCVLCLIVQLLLWLEFYTLFPFYLTFGEFDSLELLQSLSAFLTPSLIWILLRPVFQKSILASKLERKLNRFRSSGKLFTSALEEQKKVTIPTDLPRLLLSEDVSSPIITLVTNPFCEPCAKLHNEIDAVLKKTSNNVRLEIIFLTTEDEEEPRSRVSAHLIALYMAEGSNGAHTALSKWFSMKTLNYETWASQHRVAFRGEEMNILKMHRDWCASWQITSTPAVFFNGRSFPEMYEIEDIASIL